MKFYLKERREQGLMRENLPTPVDRESTDPLQRGSAESPDLGSTPTTQLNKDQIDTTDDRHPEKSWESARPVNL